MAQGYYTIEQWTGRPRGWAAVAVLPFGLSQTAAEREIEKLGTQGLYRLVQMQRVIWCERDEHGTMRLRKSHASSPGNLKGIEEIYDRVSGVYPAAEVRAARISAKQKRKI